MYVCINTGFKNNFLTDLPSFILSLVPCYGTEIHSLPSSFYTIFGSVSGRKEIGMLVLAVLQGCELRYWSWKRDTVESDQLFLHRHHARGINGCL